MMFDYYFAYVKHITSHDIEADYVSHSLKYLYLVDMVNLHTFLDLQ